MATLINKNREYKLFRPLNCSDMNYHLIHVDTGEDHLIDICDVSEDENDYDYLSWEKLKTLEDIEHILTYVWKII